MKKTLVIIIAAMLCLLAISCGNDFITESEPVEIETVPSGGSLMVGFSQLGAESDWRSANTESMKATFTQENGFELIFEDGQQKQANQITAIRTFIQQDVDYIVLAPVTETGWDTVLQEAKDAGIPVIIVDRMVNVSDESLFTCWVGSNFELEGKKVAEWLNQYAKVQEIAPSDLHIVNIQGTMGASAQIGRSKGLSDAAKAYGWDLVAEASGDFTQAKGREVMESFLKRYPNINVVYCENDNEAFGAIEAIEASGKKAGSDIAGGEIMVLSFDGVKKDALQYVLEDKITCLAECNPLHGPRVQAIIEALEAGVIPEKFSYVHEEIFSSNNTVSTITVEGTNFEVKLLTSEMVEKKS